MFVVVGAVVGLLLTAVVVMLALPLLPFPLETSLRDDPPQTSIAPDAEVFPTSVVLYCCPALSLYERR